MWTASIAHGIRVANSYSVETWLPHQPLSSPFRRVGNSAPSPYLFCFDQRKGEKFSPPRLYDVLLHRTYFLKIGANRRVSRFHGGEIIIFSLRQLEKEMDICSHLFAFASRSTRMRDYLFYARAKEQKLIFH